MRTTPLFCCKLFADEDSENVEVPKSKFERVILSYLSLCTEDNIGPSHSHSTHVIDWEDIEVILILKILAININI